MADDNDPALLDIVTPTIALLEEYFTRRGHGTARIDDKLVVSEWEGYQVECRVTAEGYVTLRATFVPRLPVEEIVGSVDLCNRWNTQYWIGTASAAVDTSFMQAATVLWLDHAAPLGAGVNRLQLHELVRAFLSSADDFDDVLGPVRNRLAVATSTEALEPTDDDEPPDSEPTADEPADDEPIDDEPTSSEPIDADGGEDDVGAEE